MVDILNNISNQFTVIYQQDGVYLIVKPSKTIDKNQLLGKIMDKITLKSIKNVDRKAVQSAVESANGDPVKIADKQEEVKVNASLNVTISPDKMAAYITITPPDGGSALSSDEILKQLHSRGVTSGIDEVTLASITAKQVYNEVIEIAVGNKPINGEDGKLELLFDTSSSKKPRILEDGSVDFHELNYIKTVQKGQTLAKIIPPRQGVDGKNVLGQVITAPRGKAVPIPKGKNVEIINEGTTVIASIDGYASFVDNKLNVSPILEIPENVDVSTGNIRFNGSIVIKGNVLTDFVVEANGDVEVHGVVEGATIKADGDIILKRGILGTHKGVLISGHDIIAKYIEHSTVTAKNDVRCEAIMHSTVKCGNEIEIGGKKGLIVGGSVKAGKEINAKAIGSPMSTPTDIEVGIDPTIRDRYKEIKEKHSKFEFELNSTQKSIEILRKMESANTITIEKKIMLNKLVQLKAALSEQTQLLHEEIEKLEESLNSVHQGRIRVRNTIYAGVKVTIGSASKFIKDNTNYVTLYLEGVDIKTTPYEA